MIVYDFVHAYVAVFVQIVNVWCKSLCLYVCLLSFDGVYVYVGASLQVVCMQGDACMSVCVGVFICLIIMCVIWGIPPNENSLASIIAA